VNGAPNQLQARVFEPDAGTAEPAEDVGEGDPAAPPVGRQSVWAATNAALISAMC
jgi:hypothetical protein